MHEDAALDLLREMAAQKVLVEVALSSTDQILGVKGQSPSAAHVAGVRRAGRDGDRRMGVSRSTQTQEFMKAVEEQASGLQDDEGARPELDRVLVRGSSHQNAVEDGSREGVPHL